MAESSERVVRLPLWVIVHKAKHSAVGLPTSAAIAKDPQGMPIDEFLPLFTTRDLAIALIEGLEETLVGHAPLELTTPAMARSLVSASQIRVTHIGIDVKLDHTGHISGKLYETQQMLDALEGEPHGHGRSERGY